MPQIIPDDLELQRDSIKVHSTRSTTTLRWKCATLGLAGFRSIWPSRTVEPLWRPWPHLSDDVPDGEWSQVLEIACRVIQKRIGSGKLGSRELACTAINTAITSADVTFE